MIVRASLLAAAVIIAGGALGGCSAVTPTFGAPGAVPQKEWLSDRKLIDHIQCQLGNAVRAAAADDLKNAGTIDPQYRSTWLRNWAAKVSLVYSVDDKAALTPSLTYNHIMQNAVSVFVANGNVSTAQGRSTGVTGTLSSEAIATKSMAFTWSFADLLDNKIIDFDKCEASKGLLLSSDLKIYEFLGGGVDIADTSGVLSRKAGESPFDTFSYDVKFIVTEGGSVTPGWKLLRVSANQAGTLFAASKVSTDDLTITMGKVTGEDKKPSSALETRYLADLIRQSFSDFAQRVTPQ